MDVYTFDKITGEYTGSLTIFGDTFSLDLFLPGACVTDVAPPELIAPGTIQVWNGEYWRIVDDKRNTVVWSKSSAEGKIVDYLGAISEEYTVMPPPSPYPIWSGDKWTQDFDRISAENNLHTLKKLEKDLELYIESVAIADGWKSQESCMAAAGFPNIWRNKCLAYVEWWQECWSVANAILADAQNGTADVPTTEQLIAAMPVMTWP